MKRRRTLKYFVLATLLIMMGIGTVLFFTAQPSIVEGSWLLVELDGELPDRVPDGWWGIASPPLSMLELRAQLRRAAGDPRIDGVVFALGQEGIRLGLTEELCALVDNLRSADKSVRVHANSLNLASWIFASHADEICLHPAGFWICDRRRS